LRQKREPRFDPAQICKNLATGERKLSKKRLALLMHTSRTQFDRVLDPTDGNVTIETLQRAAAVVGLRVELALI